MKSARCSVIWFRLYVETTMQYRLVVTKLHKISWRLDCLGVDQSETRLRNDVDDGPHLNSAFIFYVIKVRESACPSVSLCRNNNETQIGRYRTASMNWLTKLFCLIMTMSIDTMHSFYKIQDKTMKWCWWWSRIEFNIHLCNESHRKSVF